MTDFLKKYPGGDEPQNFLDKYPEGEGNLPPSEVQVPEGFEGINPVSPFDFLQSALADITAGPLVGLGETVGLVTPGTREILREEHAKNRVDFLAQNPESATRFGFAAGAEGLSMMLPLAPGGFLGKVVAGKLGARGAGEIVKTLAKGGVAGAAEGAVVGIGDTVGLKGSERVKAGLKIAGAGAAFGTAGAGAALKGRTKAPVASRKFLDTYMAESGARGDSLEDTRGLFQKMNDSLFDDKAAVLRLGKKVGGPEARKLENLVHRMRITRTAAGNGVFRAPQAWDGEKFVRVHHESLSDVLKDLPKGGHDDLQAYLLARREVELGMRAEAGDKVKVDGTAQADALEEISELANKYGVDEAGNINVLDDASRRYQEWSKRAVLVPMHAAGLLSDKGLADILGKNEHHAIFARLRENLFRPSHEGKPLHFIGKGLDAKDKVRPPIEEAAFMAMRVSEFVDRQLVRQQLVQMAEASPSLFPNFGKATPELKRMDVQLSSKERKRLGIPKEADDKTFEIMRMVDASPEEGAFVLFRNGKREVWGAPAPVLRALEGTNPLEAKLAIRAGDGAVRAGKLALTLPARTLRAGALTTLGFIQRNPLRDNFSAFVNSKHGFIPFWDPAKAMIDEIFSFGRSGGHTKLWSEFVDSGTMGSTLVGLDRATGGETLRAVRRLGTKGKAKHFVQETLSNPLYPLQTLRDLSESLTRAAEFKLGRTGGRKRVAGLPIPGTKGHKSVNTLQASADAAEVSLDFSRAGSVGRVWNSFEPFINAELQDFSKFFRTLKRDPLSSVRAVTAITLPALASWARWHKDPEYQKRPEWEKKMFIHLAKKGDGGFHMIPRPLGMLNVIYGLAPLAAMQHKFDKDPEAAEKFAEALIDETPMGIILDPFINPMIGRQAGSRTLPALTPAAVDPLLENYFNYDTYFEREVVPRRLLSEFPERQFTSSTPKLAVAAGRALGVSPMKLTNLVEGYFGTVGSDLLRSAGILFAGEKAVPLDPQVGLRGTPFVGSGLRATQSSRSPLGLRNQFARDLFELRDESTKSRNAYDALVKEGNQRALLKFAAEHPEALISSDIASTAQMLAQRAVDRREVLEEATISEEERMHLALQMDEAIDVLSVEAMKAYTAGMLEIRVNMLDQLQGDR